MGHDLLQDHELAAAIQDAQTRLSILQAEGTRLKHAIQLEANPITKARLEEERATTMLQRAEAQQKLFDLQSSKKAKNPSVQPKAPRQVVQVPEVANATFTETANQTQANLPDSTESSDTAQTELSDQKPMDDLSADASAEQNQGDGLEQQNKEKQIPSEIARSIEAVSETIDVIRARLSQVVSQNQLEAKSPEVRAAFISAEVGPLLNSVNEFIANLAIWMIQNPDQNIHGQYGELIRNKLDSTKNPQDSLETQIKHIKEELKTYGDTAAASTLLEADPVRDLQVARGDAKTEYESLYDVLSVTPESATFYGRVNLIQAKINALIGFFVKR